MSVEIRTGKFGQYFYDTDFKHAITLEDAAKELTKYREPCQNEVAKVKVTYAYGDKIKINNLKYLISQIESYKIALICLYDGEMGNRKREGVKVSDPTRITEEEMKEISGRDTCDITRII
jgi:hypothetical protein